MTVAVLALQGAFLEHEKMLEKLGADWFEIRQPRDLDRPFDGLILPGGESTTMGKLLRDLDLYEPLRAKIQGRLPVYGTCAGLILLAETVDGGVPCFATMDIAVKRNAYGRYTALDPDWDLPAQDDSGHRDIVEIIRAMPPQYRSILELKFVLEWSDQAIASHLGLSPGTVRTRIWRGRKLLQETLIEEGYQP